MLSGRHHPRLFERLRPRPRAPPSGYRGAWAPRSSSPRGKNRKWRCTPEFGFVAAERTAPGSLGCGSVDSGAWGSVILSRSKARPRSEPLGSLEGVKTCLGRLRVAPSRDCVGGEVGVPGGGGGGECQMSLGLSLGFPTVKWTSTSWEPRPPVARLASQQT